MAKLSLERSLAELLTGFRGALRLARGDGSGIGLLPSTPEGAARSFWVAALCLPIFVLLRLIMEPVMLPTWRGVAAEVTGYVVAWAGYALATLSAARSVGREALWPRFVAAWNWINFLQYSFLLVASLVFSAILAEQLRGMLSLAVIGYALWLQWFAASKTLQINGGVAAAFVTLDLFISLLLSSVVAAM